MEPLGVVVPAYRPDVDRLNAYVAALDERLAPARILIELDAPRGGCVEALKDGPATVSVSPDRRGKGRAIAAGFDRLVAEQSAGSDSRADERGGTLAFFDADASTPPESAAAVVAPVLGGETDLAVGSRRHPEAVVGRHQTLGRRRLGDAFAWCARRVVEPSLSDYQCGAKALSATAWTDVGGHLGESGFGWDLELVVMAATLGYEIEEVPIEWHDRPRSTVPPVRTALALARSLYVARRRANRLGANDRPAPKASGPAEDESTHGRSGERGHVERENAGG